jgi:long-chain fatty acid transport protein
VPVAQAQGFGLNEIGSCAVGRAYAATSSPCNDASTIFWNPAGLTRLAGASLYAGAAGVSIDGDFTADITAREFEGDVPLQVPPHGFFAYRATPRIALGLGVYVPYGLTSQWRDDFPGRFSALKASLQSIYIQPTVAFELIPGKLSIGAAPIAARSSVELNQAVDLSEQQLLGGPTFGQLGIPLRTEFARARLEGNDWAFGFNAGAHAQLGEDLQVGVRYLSKLKFHYDGAEATFEQVLTGLTIPADLPVPGGPTISAGTPVDQLLAAQFAAGAPLSDQAVSTEITHPWQLQGGIAFTGISHTMLAVEVARIGWGAFKQLPVDFENDLTPDQNLIEDYKDSWTLRTGAEYEFENGWTGRAGFAFSQSPAPDETVTPLLPEMDRNNFALGLGVPLNDRLHLDAAYLRVQGEGRRGRIVERTSRTQTAEELNSGFYRLNANVFSLSLRLQLAAQNSQGDGR